MNIFELAENDAAVKAVFDHVRNDAIAAVMLGSAMWLAPRTGGAAGVSHYIQSWAVFLLFALGAFLVMINALHGIAKLSASSLRWYVQSTIWLLYGGCAGAVIYTAIHQRAG